MALLQYTTCSYCGSSIGYARDPQSLQSIPCECDECKNKERAAQTFHNLCVYSGNPPPERKPRETLFSRLGGATPLSEALKDLFSKEN